MDAKKLAAFNTKKEKKINKQTKDFGKDWINLLILQKKEKRNKMIRCSDNSSIWYCKWSKNKENSSKKKSTSKGDGSNYSSVGNCNGRCV